MATKTDRLAYTIKYDQMNTQWLVSEHKRLRDERNRLIADSGPDTVEVEQIDGLISGIETQLEMRDGTQADFELGMMNFNESYH